MPHGGAVKPCNGLQVFPAFLYHCILKSPLCLSRISLTEELMSQNLLTKFAESLKKIHNYKSEDDDCTGSVSGDVALLRKTLFLTFWTDTAQ